jgi:adenosine deaminase
MEFYRLLVAKQITPSDINKIQLNSVEASFANESEKASLLVKVNDHFFAEDQMMAAVG